MKKTPLFGQTLNELRQTVAALGEKPFVGNQLADWLYKKDILTFEAMNNLPKAFREKLEENFTLGRSAPIAVQESVDGTKKYLFSTPSQHWIEAAYIPDKERATLCVSSQAGCKMGCMFCMTGKQGFQANLTTGEILNQIKSLPEQHTLTNIVYMGMGEPFDNTANVLKSLEILTAAYGFEMSPKRITVSSIGILPGLLEFLHKSECHLAISMHTPFEEERKQLMPIEKVYPIREIINIIRMADIGRQRRVSFEYILFDGFNDTPKHVKEIVRLLSGIRCRINLIRFHSIPGTSLKGTPETQMIWFRDALNKKGITATIRASRGEDIYAACGLLSTKALHKNKENRIETPEE
ncbi:MAG: 23S rRNA (adenine(2503)-C(2))-methyltransferase RlmN [Bacteroidia bacterium]|nr:23S rRNA (adenine(2503)-C(2))-methyltransferase RlmN [Bacteroidia bacterium]